MIRQAGEKRLRIHPRHDVERRLGEHGRKICQQGIVVDARRHAVIGVPVTLLSLGVVWIWLRASGA